MAAQFTSNFYAYFRRHIPLAPLLGEPTDGHFRSLPVIECINTLERPLIIES
jgi:hypothetical protein